MRVIISPIIAECEFWAVSESRRPYPGFRAKTVHCYAQGFGRGNFFPVFPRYSSHHSPHVSQTEGGF